MENFPLIAIIEWNFFYVLPYYVRKVENRRQNFPLFVFRIYSYLKPLPVNKIFTENQGIILSYSDSSNCHDYVAKLREQEYRYLQSSYGQRRFSEDQVQVITRIQNHGKFKIFNRHHHQPTQYCFQVTNLQASKLRSNINNDNQFKPSGHVPPPDIRP